MGESALSAALTLDCTPLDIVPCRNSVFSHATIWSVVPALINGYTDSHFFRQKKIVSYGFIPVVINPAEAKGIHGINERIGVKELADGIQRMVELLKIFGEQK